MDVAASRRFRHLPRKEYLLHQKNENRRTACPCQEKVDPHTFVSVYFRFTGARERRCGGVYGRKSDLTGLSVTDGDTLVIDYHGIEETVRLIGVDCPESVHPDSVKNTNGGTDYPATEVLISTKNI